MSRLIPSLAVVFLLANLCAAQASQELRVATRFGTLNLDDKDQLLFNGHLLKPVMRANSGIDASPPFHVGASDVVLVSIIGGTACPYVYHFVTVTKSGAKPTGEFGTCAEAESVERKGAAISLTMHDYRGPFEPEEERIKASKRIEVFIFRDGVVMKDGKPVKMYDQ